MSLRVHSPAGRKELNPVFFVVFFDASALAATIHSIVGVASVVVGADPEAHSVIFTKNTTEALNKLAHRYPFSGDDVVLCSLMEHHSNDLPWRASEARM